MDVYKLKVSDWGEKPLDKDRFEAETKKKRPYYVIDEKGRETYFAVCPACDNPIQIIGFYRRLRHTDKPYAKHYAKSVPALATYRQEAYEYCPYANPRQHDRAARKSPHDPLGEKILALLVQEFDRVIYLLEKAIGLRISNKLAEQMLVDYKAMEGHLYTGATLSNIPWVFAYMTNSKSIVGRNILDTDMVEAIIEKVDGASVDEESGFLWQSPEAKASKQFLDINYCFIHHRSRREDHSVKESMVMEVTQGSRAEQVYRKAIEFDREAFQRLIHASGERVKRPRKDVLVGMAKRILRGLE
ncbi:hypothetical protein L861_06430 [Litchfieldella anticariensis FP35 = DSM 16096]|uniref:Uncharacterized protein n=1 Tax=Litchfieldella anticariensis (strain DSM 16096 / CECT 5854 / CIP 108499 / LMG 22089 / FP35) TaxID=1121939 RepID=S2KF81_LITA3|nr:hypothetical protein [Halomonas anticariensis]EPC00570.1 hypothetical protein L861_06430 [Halomonas anticariensis FP35 = DSM 16096]